MKIFFSVIILLFVLAYVFLLIYSSRYYSPYKLIIIFGKKACGKSTDIVKRALKFQKLGYRTFCSERDVKVCEYFDPQDFGLFSVPKSVIFLDEAGALMHKRDFADKSKFGLLKQARIFSKWLRHEEMICFIYSQSFDIDLSLKENADELWYYKKVFGCFTYGKRIVKTFTITEPDADRPGAFMDSYEFAGFFQRGSRMLTFIPRYSKYFDSFKKLGLPSYEEFYHLPRDSGGIGTAGVPQEDELDEQIKKAVD